MFPVSLADINLDINLILFSEASSIFARDRFLAEVKVVFGDLMSLRDKLASVDLCKANQEEILYSSRTECTNNRDEVYKPELVWSCLLSAENTLPYERDDKVMPTLTSNYGSTARDYCMLERNFLSHAKLALLLTLVSSSVLLQARLDSPTNPEEHGSHTFSILLAAIEITSAFVVIGSGLWEYESGIRDMQARRAFLLSTEPHLVIVAVIAAVVFITCVVFLVNKGGIVS